MVMGLILLSFSSAVSNERVCLPLLIMTGNPVGEKELGNSRTKPTFLGITCFSQNAVFYLRSVWLYGWSMIVKCHKGGQRFPQHVRAWRQTPKCHFMLNVQLSQAYSKRDYFNPNMLKMVLSPCEPGTLCWFLNGIIELYLLHPLWNI